MNNKRNRRIAIVVAVLMLTMVFSSTGFAAWMNKTIEASYRNISIWVNGEYKQAKTEAGVVVEPFIVDGTTYVPLRGISEMLGYDVSFNPANYRIDITGDTAGGTAALEYQLLVKDAQIAELQAQLEEAEDSSADLGDLEEDLNDDYPEFDSTLDIDDIFLDGDEDDIEVEIYLDASDDNDDFDYWYETIDDYEDDIIDFLQDVVDDILAEYDDADITGFIGFEEDDDTYVDFTIDSSGDVDLDGTASGYDIDDIAELEDVLNDEFDRDSGFDFKIDVSNEDGDEIDLEVEIQDVELADLSNSDWDDMEDYLDEMCEFIEDEYNNDIIIIGEFVDEDGDYEWFDFDGNFEWYDL